MKEIKIIVDGEEIPLNISEENLKTLISQSKLTGFERVSLRDPYYIVSSSSNKALIVCEKNDHEDARNWDNVNYYSDKCVANWCGKADFLMRKIRRFTTVKNAGVRNDGYGFILIRCEDRRFRVLRVEDGHRIPFTPVFYSHKTAKEAIDFFGDELEELYDNCPAYI